MCSGVAVYEAVKNGADFIFKDFNRAAEKIDNIKKEDVIGKGILELFPDVEEFGLLEVLQRVWKTGQSEHFPTSFYNDQRIAGWRNNYIYKLQSGEIVAIYEDITDRKKAEQELKKSEKWFKSVVDTSPSLLVIFNCEGNIIYVSPNSKEISGYTPREITEKKWFAHPDETIKLQKLFEKAFTTGEIPKHIEFKSLKKDGKEWWVSASIKSIEDENGSFNGFVAQLFDISKHKETEEKLKKANAYHRGLLESSLDPLVTIGADGKITDVNSATEDVTGYSRKQLMGTDFSDYFTNPEKARNGYERVFNEGIVKDYELEIKHKNGVITLVSYNASVYKDENEKIIGVFAAARDITKRKVAENALKAAHDNLEIKVKERTKELEDAYKSAKNMEEQLIEAQQTAHIGSWNIDLKNNKFWISEEIFNILGIIPFVYESIKDDFISAYDTFLKTIIHPDDQKYIDKLFNELITTGKANCTDLRIIRPDGVVRIIHGNYNLILDENKNPIRAHGTIQDITERKNAEEELKMSEAYYRTIFENTGTATFIVEEDSTISLVNEECEKISGYSKEEIEGNKKWSEFVYSSYIPKMEEYHNMRRSNSESVLRNYEFEFIDRYSNIKNVTATVAMVPGTKKSLISLIDITHQKITENDLRKSETQLRIAMDLAKIVSWEYDIKSEMFTFDNHFYVLYGTTEGKERETLMSSGEYAQKFIPPEEVPHIRGEIAHALKATDPDYSGNIEGTVIRADGERRNINIRFGIVKDENGKTIKIYGANQDITELKKSEYELIRSNERFKAVMDSLDAVVYVTDMDTFEVLFVNKYSRELFGNIEGKKCWKSMQTGQTGPCPFCTNKWLLDKNGNPKDVYVWEFQNTITKRWYECRDSAIKWINGRLVRMEVATDITERKKLELKSIERSKILKNLVDELKRSNEELEQFAYITSHDLQEPLRTVASFTQLLQRRYKGKLDEDADDFMEYMVEASVRMKKMIQGLLNYSRIGKEENELKPVNLENVFNIVLSHLKLKIEENDALITHDAMPVVTGNSQLLVQLLQNLISNAIKFKNPDTALKINISVAKADDKYVICVEDNGIGIEPQYTDQIFKVFKRLHTIDEYKGVGIGLAICKRVVEFHGGEIWVESELNKGSKFCFTLNTAKK